MFFFYRLVSSPTENEHALRLSERREETQKAVRFTVEIPPIVGMTGHHRNDEETYVPMDRNADYIEKMPILVR